MDDYIEKHHPIHMENQQGEAQKEELWQHEQDVAKRSSRRRWLLIVAGVAALLPLGAIRMATSPGVEQGVLTSPFPMLLQSYALLTPGPIVSAVFWWHVIVNAAEQPNWKNGLLAALLAEFTAFPLTVILSIGVPTFFSTVFTHPEHLQQALPMLLFLSVMSFTALHYVGWYTTLCALIFGPLLGGLQGYFEWKAFLDRFERS